MRVRLTAELDPKAKTGRPDLKTGTTHAKALRRFRGPALFHGPRTSSRLGARFWPSGLTLRSSGLAFSQPLILAVRYFLELAMPFLPSERKSLLAVKGVGPTVVARLEQMGYESLSHLSKANVLDIVSKASSIVGSTCWKNSPQARAAIQSAIALAQSHEAQRSNVSSQPTAYGGG